MNKYLAIAIGLLFIAGSVFGFFLYMSSYETKMSTMTTYMPARLIPAGELITEKMVQPVTIPKTRHTEGALLDLKEIVGKRTLVPIGEQEEFLPWKLSEKKVIPVGEEELIAFPITFVEATNNFIRRGDEVSIWAEYTNPRITYFDESGNKLDFTMQEIHSGQIGDVSKYKRTVTYVEKLLDNVTVANLKDSSGREIRDAEASSDVLNSLQRVKPVQRDAYYMENFRMKPTGTPANVTLILTPEQYEKIVEAQSFQGDIKVGVGNPLGDLSNLANLPKLGTQKPAPTNNPAPTTIPASTNANQSNLQ